MAGGVEEFGEGKINAPDGKGREGVVRKKTRRGELPPDASAHGALVFCRLFKKNGSACQRPVLVVLGGG